LASLDVPIACLGYAAINFETPFTVSWNSHIIIFEPLRTCDESTVYVQFTKKETLRNHDLFVQASKMPVVSGTDSAVQPQNEGRRSRAWFLFVRFFASSVAIFSSMAAAELTIMMLLLCPSAENASTDEHV